MEGQFRFELFNAKQPRLLSAMVFKLSVALFALAATVSAATVKRVACPDGKHTATNKACCVFFSLADELQNKFDSECSEDGL